MIVLMGGAGSYVYYRNYELIQAAPIGSGYLAQILASGLFVSNRPYEEIIDQDLICPSLSFFQADIDYEKKTVTASIYGFVSHTSV